MKIHGLAKYILLIILIAPAMKISAQGITQAEIYPAVINHDDSVFLLVDTWFPYNDCQLDSAIINYGCGAVSVSAFYSTWFEEDSCSRCDTFSLGTFPNGYYALSFQMLYPDWVTADEYQGNFTVGLTMSGDIIKDPGPEAIYPNPGNGLLRLKGRDHERLIITNLKGQVIRSFELVHGQGTINTDLPAGLYIYNLLNKHSIRAGKLLIQ